ncbi:autotransporter outer membrane beta-barrel domain-containing protein [Yersinia pekkanenii]|uniref:Outer membrane autotransporter n=1 Tax=Yersinia pekkanenii TaxID=1288385 RepID=A0A0T9PJK5_9GAMM|nr:autotransporter outer membrane beta-barrel domain-containing protein [Yersinia pekkanenii]CNH68259.1 outer membrane autotransporter [Yersinia pekkanenii]CRY68114.1 outer membrane autotransporter [Yersinia pekkanenii]
MFKHFRQYLSTTSIQPDAECKQVSSRVPAAAINPITLAMVVAFSAIALPQTALAACTSTGVGTYLCEGVNTAGITLSGTDIAVETQPGFSIIEPSNTDSALSLIGSGAISYLDTHGSVLDTAGANSLHIENDTYPTGQSASTHVQANGSMGRGIFINNSSATDSAIRVDASAMISSGLGDSTALDIYSYAMGDSTVSLNTHAISGFVGIQSSNYSTNGTAITNINIADDINVKNIGAFINNSSYGYAGIVNFDSKNISAESGALSIYNTGRTVITNINVDGDINSTDSQGSYFYNSADDGLSSFTLRANNATDLLYVLNNSDQGAVITDIILTGDLTGISGGLGVDTYSNDGDVKTSVKLANVNIEDGNININARSQNGNSLVGLDISGNVSSENHGDVFINASGVNSTIIANVNNIYSQAGNSALETYNTGLHGLILSAITATGDLITDGIGARFQSYVNQGDATAIINLNNVTSVSEGVDITTFSIEGNSATSLTVAGQINSSEGKGILLRSSAESGNTLINVDANNIVSKDDAIYISDDSYNNTGLSAIDIITRGALVSQEGYGINIETNTAESYVTVGGLVHGGNGTAIGIHRLDNINKSATLELQSGYALEGATQALVFNGNYVDLSNASLDLANSHLVLGGTGGATFDLSRIDNREEAILDGEANRITGFGTLTKTNNSIWTLTDANMNNGSVNAFLSANIAAGILVLDNATLGLTSTLANTATVALSRLSAADIAVDPTLVATETGALTLDNGAALSSLGASTLIGNLTSAGEILLSNRYTGGNGSATDDRLTVTGNYAGENAWLTFDTVLGDDNSATDTLVIEGNATGTTSVRVNNAGGLGADTVKGINLIAVGGLAQDGTFLLAGDYVTTDGYQAVVGGAYAYTLHADGQATTAGRNWYLSSELPDPEGPGPEGPDPDGGDGSGPRYQAGVPLYEQYPQILAALNTLPTLQQRVGNRDWSQGALTERSPDSLDNNQWAWGRIEGSRQVTDPARSTSGSQRDIDIWTLQTGIDMPLYQGQDGSLLAGGVNFSYGKAKADISAFFGYGSIDTSGYGIGTSLTWYGNNGVYVDGQLQTMWFNSDLNSSTEGHSVASDNNGRGYASAIETGKRYSLGHGLSLTPQMQVTYLRVDFDTFRDPFGSEVSLQDGDSLRGRVGVSLDKETAWTAKDGTTRRTHIYSNVDLHNEFLNGSKVHVSGVEFATRDERQSVGVGAGGTYEWQNGRYAVYGNVNLLSATRNAGDNHTVGGTIGARVSW